MVDAGKNIRSVIKNATLGGLDKKIGVEGKGNTIATGEEIYQSKMGPETPKMSFRPQLGVGVDFGTSNSGLNNKVPMSTPKSEVVSQPKVEQGVHNAASDVNVSSPYIESNPFQNIQNQPIDMDVKQIGGQSIGLKEPIKLNLRKAEERIDTRLKELEKDKQKRIAEGVENLYIDAYNTNVDGGVYTLEEVLSNPKYQQQFKGVDEKVIASMLEDANQLAQGEYDVDNVLALMDKYKELGLQVDLDKLPPQTKAQYVSAMLNEDDGGLGGVIDHIAPFNLAGEAIGLMPGVENPRDYNQKMQQWAEDNKHDFLTQEELNEMIENKKKALDKEYSKYYTNDAELVDKDLQKIVDREFDKWIGTQMVTTPEQRAAKKEEIIKELGYAYQPREGKNWKDKKMEAEYNQKLAQIEREAKKEHGDTFINWGKNLGLDATLVVGQGLDIVRNPGKLVGGLLSMAKGAIHKSIEGYADLLDTAIATAQTAIDKDKEWNGVEYRVGDVGEKVAKRKGYEDYDDMVLKMEEASKDNPALGVATWFLKQGQKDLGTADALLDYLGAAYGSKEKIGQTMKENPVQMASDIISIFQLGTMGAAKMGIIDAAKAEQIVKFIGKGDLYEQTMRLGNAAQFGWVNKAGVRNYGLLGAEMKMGKFGLKTIGAPLKWGKSILDVFVNRLSGLTKEERAIVRENPELTEKYLMGKENSQGLLDRIMEKFNGLMEEKKFEGEEYEKIHQSNAPITVKNILDGVSKVLKKYGAELAEDGSVKINKSYTPAIDRKIQELGQFLQGIRELGNKATAEDAHWLRQQVDTLKKWEGNPTGIEGKADAMFGEVRRAIDNEIRRAVPDLKDLDARYVQTREAIKDLKQDWISKDGGLKDTAYSRIRNITNKGANEPKLARLEKLIPGITEDLKAYAVAQSIEKAGKQAVGQYASQIFGVGGGILGITSLLSGGLSAGPLVLGILGGTLATPRNLVRLLKFQGNLTKGMKGIIDKIGSGIGLTAGETNIFTKYLNDNQKTLQKDAKFLYENGEITEEEYKAALKNKDKEVKNTGKGEKKDYKGDGGKYEEKIWEETTNPETGKPYTKEEVNKKVVEIRDRILGDEKELNELYEEYKRDHKELPDDEVVQGVFEKGGYINPDGLRTMINKKIAKEMGVSDNILASTNHPAVSKIADKFIEMATDDVIKRAKNGEDINVAFIGGGGGSGKSKGARAMIDEGFVKKGDKVQLALDVQGGGDELEKIMEKAKKEGVLDKMHFKVAYVYASTEDAGKGVIKRTARQNADLLAEKGLDIKDVKNKGLEEKNRMYAGRTLPFTIFEEGHLKSIGEKKGLFKYLDLAKEADNIEFMITERGKNGGETTKHIIKQDGEWKIDAIELDRLLTKIVDNKYDGLNWNEVKKEGKKALENGEISQRQYDDLFGKEGELAMLLAIVSAKVGGRNNLD